VPEVADQVSVALCPRLMVVGATVRVTVGGGVVIDPPPP
jgi:hypothetical protein